MNSLDQLTGPATPLYPDPLPFTWNLTSGARRWRDALGRVRDTLPSGSATEYGVDVLVVGDSTGTYGDVYQSWPHFLKVLLQERFNRSGIAGGFGFMPFNTQNSTSNDWTIGNGASDTWATAHNTVGIEGTSWYQAKISTHAGTNDCKIWRYFDPTAAAGVYQRQAVTDWEYVGLCYSSVAEYAYLDSATSNGALTPSNKVHCTDAGTWGYHWTRQTGLSPTVAHTIQVCNDSLDSPYQLWANGAILYNGDYNEGVRLHNLSSVGSDSGLWWDSGSATNLQANFDNFCTAANGGARNTKLILVNTMLNDCGITSANISAATYKSNIQSLIAHATGLASTPCVGLVINQPWNAALSNGTQLALYPSYRDACYQLANQNDNVFVVDFWKVLTDANHPQYAPHGAGTTGGAVFDRGWYNDGTHLLGTGNQARARAMFSALSYGS